MKSVKILLVIGASVLLAQGPLKKVTRVEAMNAVTSRSQPDYPAMARQLKIEGTVELDAVVTETGTVEEVSIVSGNPILTKPAAEAVKKWKFAPFLQDGKPIRASAPITIVFKKQ
jgi:protein TonB